MVYQLGEQKGGYQNSLFNVTSTLSVFGEHPNTHTPTRRKKTRREDGKSYLGIFLAGGIVTILTFPCRLLGIFQNAFTRINTYFF